MSDQFKPGDIQDPTYPQYTNLALNDGLFDQLMKTAEEKINSQFKAGRITGNQYSEVYLGMLQAVLQNTTQYLLGTKLIDQERSQAEASVRLTEAQINEVEGNLRLIDLQEAELRFRIENIYPLEKQKLEVEIRKVEGERLLIDAQVEKAQFEVEFMLPKMLEKITAEIAKLNAEIDFLQAQEAMMIKQAQKIDKEIEFLTAKIATEWANTQGNPGGLIGKQMSLLTAQKLGFAGDIYTKVAKMYADYDAVYQSVQEAVEGNSVGGGASGAASSASGVAGMITGA